MKKTLLIVIILAVAGFFFQKHYKIEIFPQAPMNESEKAAEEKPVAYVNENKFVPEVKFDSNVRSFKTQELNADCEGDPAICAVDLAVKCSVNPKLDFCDKKRLPRFVFMEDESLGRPTYVNYKVLKIHPIDASTVEVQTESTCDGLWFGLCNGNIIYVVNKDSKGWKVNEIYALERYI
ncbi:MAG: hypothetical protein ACK5N8_04945 [Alphaproteobacteria bacterium]